MNRVKPNPWAGFRTPRTMSDPRVWYAVNRAMGIDLMLGGVLYLAGVAATYAFRGILGGTGVLTANMVVLFGGLGWMVVRGFLIIRKM